MSLQTYLLAAMLVLVAASLLLVLANGIAVATRALPNGVGGPGPSAEAAPAPVDAEPAGLLAGLRRPAPADRRTIRRVVDASIAMQVIRRLTGRSSSRRSRPSCRSSTRIRSQHRIGVPGAAVPNRTQPALVAGMAAESRRPRRSSGCRATPRRPADRRRLWRDCAAAARRGRGGPRRGGRT